DDHDFLFLLTVWPPCALPARAGWPLQRSSAASHRTLSLVFFILRLDQRARLSPRGTPPTEHLGDRAAVGLPAGAVEGDGLAGEPFAAVGHEESGEVLQLGHAAVAMHGIGLRRVAVLAVLSRIEALAHAFGRKHARSDGVKA